MDDNRLPLSYPVNNGECPNCGGVVRVLESEMTEVQLHPDGTASNITPLSLNTVGYCCNCKRPLLVDIDKDGRYIVTNSESTAVYLRKKINEILGK